MDRMVIFLKEQEQVQQKQLVNGEKYILKKVCESNRIFSKGFLILFLLDNCV